MKIFRVCICFPATTFTRKMPVSLSASSACFFSCVITQTACSRCRRHRTKENALTMGVLGLGPEFLWYCIWHGWKKPKRFAP